VKTHVMTTRRRGILVVGLVVGALVLGACGGEFRAERQGRQLGEAICDVRDAGSVEEAQRELDKAQREMNDLERIVGRPLNEDIEDIDENLNDLVAHAVDDNDALLQQDIAVIQRNLHAVGRTLTGKADAAYDGIQEGLGSCDY
jgi:hypothetical protein